MLEITGSDKKVIIRITEKNLQMFVIAAFKVAVAECLATKPAIVIFDFAEVKQIDSSAMGALFQIQKQMSDHGGNCALINVSPRITQILKVTGSDKFLKIYETADQALAQFQQDGR
jgi:anti-anti-sigma factor